MRASAAEGGLRAASFALRHAVGAATVTASVLLFTLVSWLGLLVWAVLAGEPIGGPLALPFMLVVACVAGVGIAFVLFAVTALAELVCRKLLRWPWVTEIPVSMLLLTLLVVGPGLVSDLGRDGSFEATGLAALVTCVLLVPLGIYFWSMRSAGWLLELARKLAGGVRTRFGSQAAGRAP